MNAEKRGGRYERQTVIPAIGEAGQERLLSSSVLIAGLGGLGSPVALYLAAAGIGRLGLVDPDTVSESNLQRQVIHGLSTMGRKKVESAAARLRDLNPDVRVTEYPGQLTPVNAASLVREYDVVVACLDNMESRYLLNDACVGAGKPLVEGGVMRFSGMITTIVPGKGPCYRCIFPETPGANPMDPARAGILGPVPGVIGSMQAMEVLKLVLGIGEPLVGRLLLVDMLACSFKEVVVPRNPSCPSCGGLR
ncbi:MAG: HesA/MoeB/ThiF family protein [Ignavibacteriales bacterium]